MNTIRRLCLPTVLGVLIIALWSLILWPYLVHGYAQMIVFGLQVFVTEGTKLQVETNNIIVYDSRGTAIVRKNLGSLNEFGLLLALFLAIPVIPLSQRVRRLLLALGIQILLHIVALVLLIWIAYEFYFGINKQSFAYWLLNLLMAGNLIFPILIWALLTFRYWFPKPTARTTAPAPQSHRKPKEARP